MFLKFILKMSFPRDVPRGLNTLFFVVSKNIPAATPESLVQFGLVVWARGSAGHLATKLTYMKMNPQMPSGGGGGGGGCTSVEKNQKPSHLFDPHAIT